MTTPDESGDTPVGVLSRALEQAADLLAQVRPQHLGLGTPCADWTVQQLVDHVVQAPGRFAAMMRGEQPDWSAAPPHSDEPEAEFRRGAGDLLALWHEQDEQHGSGRGQAAWQCAELAVHSWDLARGIGAATDDLDGEVAERGLSFMQANLTEENRTGVFGPERPAPEGASPYDRIAAFAGRTV